MDKSTLSEVKADQLTVLLASVPGQIAREISYGAQLNAPEISVITGVRRSGKSMLLRQIARAVKDKVSIHYRNCRSNYNNQVL